MPLFSEDVTAVYNPDTLKFLLQEMSRGTIIADRYEVIEELGRGGMGTVYKVFDKKIKEKIALKLIRPEIALNEQTIERFQNELRTARKIVHKNVCRMYDLGEDNNLHFITMEYISGRDLKQMIRMTKQLNIGTAVAIAKQVCEGLLESHRLGVVHRDLKPQNIMIDNDGSVRIMDFGIARSLYTTGVTATGVLIGTPEYMAPEQAEAKDVDQRTDIYALGAILFEMVTGEVPFSGDTPISIAIKHKQEEPRDPREINAQIPEDLSQVILKCLEKNKEDRYPTAADLFRDLSNIEQGIPTIERVIPKRKSDTSKEITVTFSPKKILIPAAVILIAAALGLAGWQIFFKKDNSPPSQGFMVSGKSRPAAFSEESRKPSDKKEKKHVDLTTIPQPPQVSPNLKFEVPDKMEVISSLVKGLTSDEKYNYGDAKTLLQYLRLGASGIIVALPPQYLDRIGDYLDYLEKTSEGTHVFKNQWQTISEKVKRAQESAQQGKAEEAKKYFGEAQTEFEHFFKRIEIKNETDSLRIAVKEKEKEKEAISSKPNKGETLLYSLASSTIKNADEAYSNKEFTKSKILYKLSGEILSLSDQCRDERGCAAALKRLVDTKWEKAKTIGEDKIKSSVLIESSKLIGLGGNYYKKGDYKKTAEHYIESAVLLEQAIQNSLKYE